MNTHIYIPMRRIFSLVLFFLFPRWIDYTLTSYFLLIFPPSLNWSKCLCARCGFFFQQWPTKGHFPFNSVFPPSLNREGYTPISYSSLVCARAHKHKHAGLGWASRFSISLKKRKEKEKKTCDDERVPASSLSRSSSARVCCSSSISFSIQSLKKKKKL